TPRHRDAETPRGAIERAREGYWLAQDCAVGASVRLGSSHGMVRWLAVPTAHRRQLAPGSVIRYGGCSVLKGLREITNGLVMMSRFEYVTCAWLRGLDLPG